MVSTHYSQVYYIVTSTLYTFSILRYLFIFFVRTTITVIQYSKMCTNTFIKTCFESLQIILLTSMTNKYISDIKSVFLIVGNEFLSN